LCILSKVQDHDSSVSYKLIQRADENVRLNIGVPGNEHNRSRTRAAVAIADKFIEFEVLHEVL
jgi:hypothetical protein